MIPFYLKHVIHLKMLKKIQMLFLETPRRGGHVGFISEGIIIMKHAP